MKRNAALFLVLLAAAGFASAKPKHPRLPEVFATAKTFHVETRGAHDITDISLDQDTRTAILDVQNAIQDWGRYSVSRSRREAGLILVIYKGHVTRENALTLGSPRSSNGPMSRGPIQDPADASQGNGSTSPDGYYQQKDELDVCTLNANGKLKILWHSEIVDGLDTPNLILVNQLEREIEKAYPNPPAATQSNP